MTLNHGKGSRPAKGEHGLYTTIEPAEGDQTSPSTVDASEFPTETHSQLQSTEKLKAKVSPELSDVALATVIIAPHSTGYAAKHDEQSSTAQL